MEQPAARNEPDNVIELGSAIAHAAADARTGWFELPGREILPEDWRRFRSSVAEIFEAFGMDLRTPGTKETPERFLRALFEATSGYDGDPKLQTTFAAESSAAGAGISQIIEGPIDFHCLCEHHALPFHGAASRRRLRSTSRTRSSFRWRLSHRRAAMRSPATAGRYRALCR